MDYFINYGLRIVCYLLATIGVWLILKPVLEPNLRYTGRSIDKKIRLRVVKSARSLQQTKHTTALYEHLNRMLYLVKKDYETGSSVIHFLLVITGTFLTTLFVGLMTIGELPNTITFSNPFQDGIILEQSDDASFIWEIPLFMAIVASLIPYLILRYRFNKNNIKASYDLLEIVKILSRNSSHLSVHEALKLTAEMISSTNVLRRPLYRLSNTFMTYGNSNDLQSEVKRFESIIGTTFSTMFCHSLIFAEREGSQHLSISLLHLSSNMEHQMQVVLETHRAARDPIILGKYGGLLTFIVVLPGAAFSMGVDSFVSLMFQTKVGLICSALILISILISFVISLALARPKLDYF